MSSGLILNEKNPIGPRRLGHDRPSSPRETSPWPETLPARTAVSPPAPPPSPKKSAAAEVDGRRGGKPAIGYDAGMAILTADPAAARRDRAGGQDAGP